MDEQYQDIDVKNILHTLPNLVFWKDTNSCFRGCNQQFLGFLGLDSYTQLLYKTDHDLTPLKPYASAEIKIDQSILMNTKQQSDKKDIQVVFHDFTVENWTISLYTVKHKPQSKEGFDIPRLAAEAALDTKETPCHLHMVRL